MKAMVLAAGLGTRLRPLTPDRPKALVEVAGRTLLQITLARLRNFGIRDVIVNVHHFADRMIDYLAAHDNFGMNIAISREEFGGFVQNGDETLVRRAAGKILPPVRDEDGQGAALDRPAHRVEHRVVAAVVGQQAARMAQQHRAVHPPVGRARALLLDVRGQPRKGDAAELEPAGGDQAEAFRQLLVRAAGNLVVRRHERFRRGESRLLQAGPAMIEPPAKARSQKPCRGFDTKRNSKATPRKTRASSITMIGK